MASQYFTQWTDISGPTDPSCHYLHPNNLDTIKKITIYEYMPY